MYNAEMAVCCFKERALVGNWTLAVCYPIGMQLSKMLERATFRARFK